jgi:hypothetical protein
VYAPALGGNMKDEDNVVKACRLCGTLDIPLAKGRRVCVMCLKDYFKDYNICSRKKVTREKRAEYQRNWREKNLGRAREQWKKYYYRNQDRLVERSRIQREIKKLEMLPSVKKVRRGHPNPKNHPWNIRTQNEIFARELANV